MAMIKVTRGGCGIVYTDAAGNPRHVCKTAADKPFECDDAQARRLVSLGVAEYIGTADEVPDAAPEEPAPAPDAPEAPEAPAEESEPETPAAPGYTAEQLEGMDYNALKALAAERGVKPAGQKKTDYIAALMAADVEVEDDGDDMPELTAADPE